MKKVILWTLIAALISLTGCGGAKSIKIGFSAQLTGKQAELGVQQRNGVLMAVDEINARGGIAGRSIEILVKDDQGTPEGAVASDTELVNQGVVCIIGHATSAQTIAALPVTEEAKIVLMSPTTSSAGLAGKDDYFIRIIQSLIDQAEGLCTYIYNEAKISEMAVAYDMANKAYAGNYWEVFSRKYTQLGGSIVLEGAFDSAKGDVDFDGLLKSAKDNGAKGLMIIASDTDTALLAQRARVLGWDAPLFSSAWAQTDVLIKNGGSAIENMVLEQSFSLISKEPRYLEFQSKFRERFGKDPSFSGVLGYETMLTLEKALMETKGNATGLKEALLKTKDFEALVDTFSIDPFGDVIRPYYLGVIRDGKYEDLDKFQPDKK